MNEIVSRLRQKAAEYLRTGALLEEAAAELARLQPSPVPITGPLEDDDVPALAGHASPAARVLAFPGGAPEPPPPMPLPVALELLRRAREEIMGGNNHPPLEPADRNARIAAFDTVLRLRRIVTWEAVDALRDASEEEPGMKDAAALRTLAGEFAALLPPRG